MSCDIPEFLISKGSENTFVFTIKQDNSTLPLTIVSGDTFVASLTAISDKAAYPGVTNKTIPTVPSTDGKITLVITALETADLVVDRGPKVDRYYLRPTYILTIVCTTQNNGNFIAKVAEVYVD